ncbi:MAG TPA: aldo/keto reductase [Nitrospira sp.]|nr:aldo/keto reductase [Nitrospira sp.]
MILTELAKTGVFIPEIGIGTWDYHAGPGPLRKGLEAGALFIDTAESYGTETVVGEAIRGMRDRVFIATKVSPQNFRPADLRRSVEASLQRLGIDVIDLLQLHEPNPSIPIEETMGAVAGVIDAGKVRFAGVSNFSVRQLREAQKALARYPIVSNQVRYNLIDRTIETDLLPYCQANHVTVIAYCPLAKGLNRVHDCDPSGVIDELAQATGKTPAQIVINWCLCKNGVVAIPKGNSTQHILDNCGASDWRLSQEQLALLDSRIQYRQRSRFDLLIRQWMPRPFRAIAIRTVNALPRGLRRRLR